MKNHGPAGRPRSVPIDFTSCARMAVKVGFCTSLAVGSEVGASDRADSSIRREDLDAATLCA